MCNRYKFASFFVSVSILQVIPMGMCQRTTLDNPFSIQLYRSLKDLAFGFIGSSNAQGRHFRGVEEQDRTQYKIPDSLPFPCNKTGGRSRTVPSSVHRLRPGDIDVIAAMGDSLTAGFGLYANNIFDLFIENRGSSAFGGGQGTWRDTLTLPNILKEFNGNLFGFATRDAWSHHPESQFNVAESTSMSRDMPYMAKSLISRMRSDPRVDMTNHWKLVSIFIGANDICSDICYNPSAWASLDNHKADMLTTLRLLKDNLPRTLVSIVPVPDIKTLVEMKGRSKLCRITTDIECSCGFGLRFRHRRQEFFEINRRWIDLDEAIGTYPEFQTKDFAVVVQPITGNAQFPTLPDGRTDFRYLSADCFHLSQIANARTAFSIWRDLLEPVDQKTRSWDELDPDLGNFPCPTRERPFIATSGNS
ncbi:phospholipase B1, membrane-associated-like isoform X2 [Diachasmimorpha longicaudata]|uniref:phospholipase B1, membrane-associated-like isoform X2 n=1 Tax=Diachasmimorpha longicaudata TaxID=58733 RepID=UPI0030B8869A